MTRPRDPQPAGDDPDLDGRILALAGPGVLSNLSVPLLGAVDTALVGRLPGLGQLGAVAVGSAIFDILYWAFGFLRMGTTGMAAQAWGADDPDEVDRVLARGLWVAGAAALAIWLLQVPLGDLAFSLMAPSAQVEAPARAYFSIRLLAAPATLALYALNGWFLGVGDARTPLLIAVASNVVNMVLDVVMVKVWGLGASGVAAGTVTAQYLGLAVALVRFRQRVGRWLPVMRRPGVLDPVALRRFVAVNSDIMVRTLCLMASFTFFTARSAAAGDRVLAANALLLQLWHLMAYFVDGVAFAGETLVGQRVGARDPAGLRRLVRRLFLWGAAFGAAAATLYALAGVPLLRLFTDKPALVEDARRYLGWSVAAALVNPVCFVWDGVYLGATASRALRNAMLASTFLVYLPAWALLSSSMGNHGRWAALLGFMVARGLTLTWLAEGAVYGPLASPEGVGPAGGGAPTGEDGAPPTEDDLSEAAG